MVGVSRNTISSIETLRFNPTAKLALIICIALDKKFEDIFSNSNRVEPQNQNKGALSHHHIVPFGNGRFG